MYLSNDAALLRALIAAIEKAEESGVGVGGGEPEAGNLLAVAVVVAAEAVAVVVADGVVPCGVAGPGDVLGLNEIVVLIILAAIHVVAQRQ